MIKFATFLTIMALVGCGTELAQNSIDDGPEGANSSLTSTGPVHSSGGWQATVTLYVADNAPDIIVEATANVVRSINEAAEADVYSYGGRVAPKNRGSLFSVLEDNTTIIYFEPEWSETTGKSAGVLGTTVWENSGSGNEFISRGDIILNSEHFIFQDSHAEATDLDRLPDIVDAETVILHEAMHLAGIDHVAEIDDPDSVMHTTTPIGLDISRRQLSAGDKVLLQQIYQVVE